MNIRIAFQAGIFLPKTSVKFFKPEDALTRMAQEMAHIVYYNLSLMNTKKSLDVIYIIRLSTLGTGMYESFHNREKINGTTRNAQEERDFVEGNFESCLPKCVWNTKVDISSV